jgi:hypothetical protein
MADESDLLPLGDLSRSTNEPGDLMKNILTATALSLATLFVVSGCRQDDRHITGLRAVSFAPTGVQTWIDLAPTGGPPTAVGTIVFDPASDQAIVFGGCCSNPNDVWALTKANGLGSTTHQWVNLVTNGAAGPSGRHSHSAVYDAANNRMIIFGGCLGGCLPVTNDVWVLINANGLGGTPTWQASPTPASPTPASRTGSARASVVVGCSSCPAPRGGHTAVYDPTTNRMIIFGGQDGAGTVVGHTFSDVWVLSNANGLGGPSSWTQLSPTGGPPVGQYFASATYDPASNRMTVFGGLGDLPASGFNSNAVWVLSNANGVGGTPTWTQVVAEGAAGSPSARGNAVAGYDPANNLMTVFGGPLSDAWVLTNANGLGGASTWTQLCPSSGPPTATARGVLDVGTNRLITFGGPGGGEAWVLTDANGVGATCNPAPPQCVPGSLVPNVLLPEEDVQVLPFLKWVKPWEIHYSRLGLDFTTEAPPVQGALCAAKSNAGALNVSAVFRPTGQVVPIAVRTISTATVIQFQPGSVGATPSCSFHLIGGVTNDCILNGQFQSSHNYLSWHSDGFVTDIFGAQPTSLSTGPLTFWVDLAERQVPSGASIEAIIRTVEPFIHEQLIMNLPAIAFSTIIQDPGNVTLRVIDGSGNPTGIQGDGSLALRIPQSFYLTSATNPAVLLGNATSGIYTILVTGRSTGEFSLSVSTANMLTNSAQGLVVSGQIAQGATLSYNLNLDRGANTIALNQHAAPSASFIAAPDLGAHNLTASVIEGTSIKLALNPVPAGAAFLYAFDCGDGYGPFSTKTTSACPTIDNEQRRVRGEIDDNDGGVVEYTRLVNVLNQKPSVTLTTLQGTTSPLGANRVVTGKFKDPGVRDAPWAYSVSWGDGSLTTGTTLTQSGVITLSHTYAQVGKFSISMTVTDKDGGTGKSNTVLTQVVP